MPGFRMPANRRKPNNLLRRALLITATTSLLPVTAVQAAHAAEPAPPPSSVAQSVSTAPAPTAEAAAAAAAATGKPIEVAPATTETSRLLVNPSGSYTYEQSTHAVRARQGGKWVAVDATLTRRSDGTVAPNAAAAGIVFSGGGTGPMATITRKGVTLSLTWNQALPAPVLSGNTATYADVFPGVDLQLTATADSFSDVLVVKTAEAAALPALRELNFKTSLSGGSLQADGNGGFLVKDHVGASVFTSPQPAMWDSAATSGATSGDSVALAQTAPQTAPPSESHGVREGDHIKPMSTELAGATLSVTPDAAMLSQSKNFPIFIDPTVAADLATYTMVNKTYPDQSYWFYGGYYIVDEGVGYNDTQGINVKRLFSSFDTSKVNGKHIISATFKAYETFSYSCTAAPIQLWLTGGISGSTTWNNQPGWVSLQDSKTVAYGRSDCTPGGAWVELNATNAVAAAANAGWPTTTMGLRAQNESTDVGWKRFNDNAYLSVTYNTPPSTPTGMQTALPSTTCNTTRHQTALSSPPHTLSAVLNDADGTAGGNLTANFQIWKYGSSTPFWTGSSAPAAPGSRFTISTPSTLDVEGVDWGWKVQAYDGAEYSAWTDYCEFYIDHTAPPQPTVTPSSGNVYTVGQTVSFTFGNGGDTGVVGYDWSVNRDTGDNPVVGSTATVSVPLTASGPLSVNVWSRDAAGNRSAMGSNNPVIMVGGASQLGHWKFEDTAHGTTAADSPPAGGWTPHPLTLAGATAG